MCVFNLLTQYRKHIKKKVEIMDAIKVKCKKCGRTANSNEYVLDPVYRMMVCPMCIKDRRMGEKVRKEVETQRETAKKEVPKAPGWDQEDEYLARACKEKANKIVKVEKLDHERVKYKCPYCNYVFIYNFIKKSPGRCPFCSSNIATSSINF